MNKKLLLSLMLLPAMAMAEISVDLRFGAPPPPPRRVVVAAPGPGYLWTEGYYRFDGARYLWMPGRWMRPPRHRSAWVPAHWAQRRRGWVFVEGHWR
jgi:hypothetical protein